MKKLLPLLLLFFVCSCTQKEHLINHFNQHEQVTLTPLKDFPQDSLIRPSGICCIDNNIVLIDKTNQHLLMSFSLQDRSIQRFHARGHGQNESLYIGQIIPTDNGKNLIAHDNQLLKIYKYEKNDSLFRLVQQTQLPYNDLRIAHASDVIIGCLPESNSRFVKIDSTGKQTKFGQIIQPTESFTDNLYNYIIGDCIFNPKLNRLAFFSASGDIFELYDCNNTPQLFHSSIGKLPIWDNDNKTITPQSKLGVIATTFSDDYIFALYGEETIDQYDIWNGGTEWLNKILVYSWDGKPIKTLTTNIPVKAISYNKTDGRVYCIGKNNQTRMLYSFNPLLSQ
ncbi:MAG: BF3164 family lipoprotein [Marinifilaceae bacterium]